MKDLEFCPFCGGEAWLLDKCNYVETGGYTYWFVRCKDCGAETGWSVRKDSAVDAWNKRAKADSKTLNGVSTLTEKEVETVLAFAKCDMTVYKTAKELYFSTNAIQYRLRQVEKKTGLDPNNFYDLMKLVLSLEKADGKM